MPLQERGTIVKYVETLLTLDEQTGGHHTREFFSVAKFKEIQISEKNVQSYVFCISIFLFLARPKS